MFHPFHSLQILTIDWEVFNLAKENIGKMVECHAADQDWE